MTTCVVNLGNPVNRASPLNRSLVFWLRILPNRMARRIVDICGGYSAAMGSTQSYGGLQNGSRGIRGSNSYANFGGAIGSKITTAVTLTAVIAPRTISGYSDIFVVNNGAGSYQYSLRLNTTRAEVFAPTIGGIVLTGATALTAERTYHLCATIGAVNGAKLYVNGVQDGSSTYSGASMSSSIDHTFMGFVGGENNDGLCSDLRIHNREMHSGEVMAQSVAWKTGYQRDLNYLDTDAIYGASAAATFKSAWTRNTNTIIQPLVTA